MKSIKITPMCSGYCKQIEAISIHGGAWRNISFPATYWLIEHPTKGIGLFDTGYSTHFFKATQKFPYFLYRKITPVIIKEDQIAKKQLERMGINKIDFIILSHFHADHIGGLLDFPNTPIYCSQNGWEKLRNLKGINAIRRAFLPYLIPNDFHSRIKIIEIQKKCKTGYEVFPYGLDMFGDQSIIAIDLNGHACSQIGLLIKNNNRALFLIADAAWSRKAILENKKPHFIAYFAFHSRKIYNNTFYKLILFSRKYPHVEIYTTHGIETFEKIMGGESP